MPESPISVVVDGLQPASSETKPKDPKTNPRMTTSDIARREATTGLSRINHILMNLKLDSGYGSSMVRTWFIPPLWFAALAVAITLLAWTADDPVILGLWEALDVTGSVWSHWWTADALSRGVSPFVGTHSYLPVGLEPVLQYNLLDGIVHAPFVLLLGPQTGYNAALAFALFASGRAGFSVARSGTKVAAGGYVVHIQHHSRRPTRDRF